MKLIFKILCFTILEIIVLTSCNNKPKAEEYVFKSTKNTTDFNLFMPTGQIDICGWDKDYIEINAVTRVYSMILSDKKLIKFSHEEIEKDFNLNVLTADSLINAEIILDIKVPFLLQTINIQTKNAICNIKDTFGNFYITGEKSTINGDFKNSVIKINFIDGTINATLDMTSSTDVLLSNEQGETNINVIKTGDKSLICTNTFSGNINLVLSSSIPYLLVSSATTPHVLEFLTSSPQIYEDNNYKLFINNTSNNSPELQIFLDNENGKTKINNAFFIDIN